jgi:hypothetical protein
VARRHRFVETLERLASEEVGVPASEMPFKALKSHADRNDSQRAVGQLFLTGMVVVAMEHWPTPLAVG